MKIKTREKLNKHVPNIAFFILILSIVGVSSFFVAETMAIETEEVVSTVSLTESPTISTMSMLTTDFVPQNVSLRAHYKGQWMMMRIHAFTNSEPSDVDCNLTTTVKEKRNWINKTYELNVYQVGDGPTPYTYASSKNKKFIGKTALIECEIDMGNKTIPINVTLKNKRVTTIVPLPGPLS